MCVSQYELNSLPTPPSPQQAHRTFLSLDGSGCSLPMQAGGTARGRWVLAISDVAGGVFSGGWHRAQVYAIAPQSAATRQEDVVLAQPGLRRHSASPVPAFGLGVLNADPLGNCKVRQLTGVFVVAGRGISVPLGCAAVTLLCIRLPLRLKRDGVSGDTGAERVAVEYLCRGTSGVIRCVPHLQQSAVKCLTVDVTCRRHLHNQVLDRLYRCFGVTVGPRVMG